MNRWTDWTGACRALADEAGAAGGSAGVATMAVATERDLAGGLDEVPGAQVFEGFSRYDEHDGLLALLRGLFEGRNGRPVTLDAGTG